MNYITDIYIKLGIFGVFVFIVVFVFTLAAWPLVAIWATNTLFPQANIEYSLLNWFAAFVLGIYFRGLGDFNKKKS